MSKKVARSRQKNKGERQRLEMKKRKQEELLEQDEMEDPVAEESLLLEQDSAEELTKYYDEGEMAYVAPSPTSFEELDAMRTAQEKAHEVNKVTNDVDMLVYNILRNYEMDPSEKATRMTEVANGFAERVSAVMESEEMEKDLDALQVHAILASYERNRTLIEKGVDWAGDQIVKREVSYGERKDMPDSSFALVYESKDGKKIRKYLIHDKSHVRNALARAAQQIQGGGEGAADAKKALPKIRAAARKFGIETSAEKSLMIEKDQAGVWRWIGRPSNNFLDRQNDIISKDAHVRYCAWLDENPQMAPLFVKAHIPGTARTHRADFWVEHEGALIMSGPLTESEAAGLLKAQAQMDLGMSVHGDGLRLDPSDPRVITHYWLFEVSDLPLKDAANPFTKVEAMAKEAEMDRTEKIKYLSFYMPEEEAIAYLTKTEEAQKSLTVAGLTSKSVETAKVEESATPVVEAPAAVPTPDADAVMKQLVEKIGAEFDIPGLNEFVQKAIPALEKVELLEGILQDMQKNRDEEMEKVLTPPIARFAWSKDHRPTAQADNVISKETDKDLQNAGPKVPEGHWLAQVAKVDPVMESS